MTAVFGRSRPSLTHVLLATGVVALGVSVILPTLNRMRYETGRVPNAGRLHQIGLAILLYNQDHGPAYPATLPDLFRAEHVDPAMATCPVERSQVDYPVPYVYLGRSLTVDTAGFDTVVAYTPLAYAGGDGSDILFGDGHVNYVTAADLTAALARGGPATAPATRPATTPAAVQSSHG